MFQCVLGMEICFFSFLPCWLIFNGECVDKSCGEERDLISLYSQIEICEWCERREPSTSGERNVERWRANNSPYSISPVYQCTINAPSAPERRNAATKHAGVENATRTSFRASYTPEFVHRNSDGANLATDPSSATCFYVARTRIAKVRE